MFLFHWSLVKTGLCSATVYHCINGGGGGGVDEAVPTSMSIIRVPTSHVDYKKWYCRPVEFKKTSCCNVEFKKTSCRPVDFKKTSGRHVDF